MPRGPRLDFSGALYHVIVPGIERPRIFRSGSDRELFLDRLAEWVLDEVAVMGGIGLVPFGRSLDEARCAYRTFVHEYARGGQSCDLDGGGLRRSLVRKGDKSDLRNGCER